jgi:hypothetical protein
MSISRELFPETAAIDLYGSATLATSSMKEISPLDTTSVGSPSGKVYLSSTSALDDYTVLTAATAYVDTVTITSSAVVTEGPKNIKFKTNSGVIGSNATITDSMTTAQIATALRATTLAGYTITGSNSDIIITCNTTGNSIVLIELDLGTDVVFTYSESIVNGKFAGSSYKEKGSYTFDVTSLVAGTMNIRFNDELPSVPIELDGSETVTEIYDLIVAATPASHLSINYASGSLLEIGSITSEVNTLKILISPGVTGIVVTEVDYQEGVDPVPIGSTGAWTVEIKGIKTDGLIIKEIMTLNGTEQVESVNSFSSIIYTKVVSAGTGNTNAGKIYLGSSGAVSGKPNLGYTIIPIGYNINVGTSFTVPSTHECMIEKIDFINPTASEILTVRLMSDYTILKEFKVGGGQTSIMFDYPIKVEGRVSLTAQSTSTTPTVTANIEGVIYK